MVKKEFPCDNGTCNHTIIAVSPDDRYTQFFSDRCCEKSKEKKYQCENCDFINIRYWCIEHTIPPTIVALGFKDPYDRFSTYV
ncbi:MAG: hypothetical protein COV65_04945 [Nitrosopumilales archaeon CG11_big_fil_rev_8_21_14_0_20_33_24]|nr:MAG: hypothetical protein COV65_04945 [Nitrosopumilales archaeon CG11_big_fil_rev_8_21_14_0_20_33_24]